MERTEIGRRMRDRRKVLGLTQEEVARRAGAPLNSVARIERGEVRDPHLSMLSGIARSLNMSVAELLGEVPAAPLAEAPSRSPSPETTEAGAAAPLRPVISLVEYTEEERREIRKRLQALDREGKAKILKLARAFELNTPLDDTTEGRVGTKKVHDAIDALDAGSDVSSLDIGTPEIIDFMFSADRNELVALLRDESGRPDLAAVVKFDEWMMARASRDPNNLTEAWRKMTEVHEALAL